MKRLLALLPALLCGCGGLAGSKPLTRVPDGAWGGQHVAVSVSASGADLEFDCAQGHIVGVIALDERGRFDVEGLYTPLRGGPAINPPPDPHAARYRGSTDGRGLTFTVTVADAGFTAGPFTVTLGVPPRVFRCLAVDPSRSRGRGSPRPPQACIASSTIASCSRRCSLCEPGAGAALASRPT
jgi:hypothetical protein